MHLSIAAVACEISLSDGMASALFSKQVSGLTQITAAVFEIDSRVRESGDESLEPFGNRLTCLGHVHCHAQAVDMAQDAPMT